MSRVKTVQVVFDMQFGSTGKGALIGKLCEEAESGTMTVSTMAPNAGHTYVNSDGVRYVHSACPLGAVFPHIPQVGIGPGSVLNIDRMVEELEYISKKEGQTTERRTVLIHEAAGVVDQRLRDREKTLVRIGSTMKGSGATQIQKIERSMVESCIALHHLEQIPSRVGLFDVRVVSHNVWLSEFDRSDTIIVEGSQGYSLGINSGFYPYTTYRECTPTQILADAAIPCHLHEVETFGVMRTFPIRVANRLDEGGEEIGYSGPCYSDQKEITWESIGIPPEYTTVTKLKRRVFTFSFFQLQTCFKHTQPDVIFINFMNYLNKNDQEALNTKIKHLIPPNIALMYGYGPKSEDIEEVLR